MTWEETIRHIRTIPAYNFLVSTAYFNEDLVANIEAFRTSEEYKETKKIINQYAPNASRILDVGSGNGVSAVTFTLDGYKVTATEPDKSLTIGAGAIKYLKDYYLLDKLDIYEDFAENINLGGENFDIIYIRQVMHHAYDLDKFIFNLSRYLKPGGLLLTIRDHVVYDDDDKQRFLEDHPLHKFYGGENAFTEGEYIAAFKNAGLNMVKRMKYYDSVINFSPVTAEEIKQGPNEEEQRLRKLLQKKIGKLAFVPPIFDWYKKRNGFSHDSFFDEKKVPGRMYSFICQKPL